MLISLASLLSLSFFTVCFAQQPCISRDYGSGTVVCVCNATYCDVAEPTTVEQLSGDVLRHYVSNKAGMRLEAMNMQFTKEEVNAEDSVVISVDKDTTYQEIFGFGGAMTDAAGINIMSLSEEAQNILLQQYFSPDGTNYKFVRVPIGGSDFSTHYYAYDNETADDTLQNFNISTEDYEYKIPLLKRVLDMSELSIKLFSTAWSAPEWMKESPDGGQHTSLKQEYYQLWADYYVKFLDAYAKEGLKFWAITPQNEPSHGRMISTLFNSMGWTSTQQREWLVGYLAPTLQKNGHSDLQIMILDDQRNFIREWSETFYDNSTVANLTSGMAIHWYVDFIAPVKYLDEVHENHPEKFILYTEACYGDDATLGDWMGGQDYLTNIIQVINHYVNGWVDWNLALDLQGGPNWADNFVNSPIIVNATADEFYKQPMYYALAHISKFVPEGSVRIELETSNAVTGVESVGFLTPDGVTVVIILNKNPDDYSVVINDQSKGSAEVSVTAYSFNTLLYKV